MRKSLAAAIACLLMLGGSISAANAGWTVARSSGQVSIGADGAQKISLRPNEELPGGATVTTGAGGRVLLTRNKEVMTIGPNAVVTIPADDLLGFTTILQKAGQVEFEVEKRNVRHFQVDTPYLAAVVKGTHFVVSVNRSGANVSVSRGRVGVTDNASGQQADILPGQSAKASRSSEGLVVTGTPRGKPGDVAKVEPGKKAKAGPDDEGKIKAADKGKPSDKGKAADEGKAAGKAASAGPAAPGNSGPGGPGGPGNGGPGNGGPGGPGGGGPNGGGGPGGGGGGPGHG